MLLFTALYMHPLCKMPVCRLIPGFTDQCENFDGSWDDITQNSRDVCVQRYPNCGPIMPIPFRLVQGRFNNGVIRSIPFVPEPPSLNASGGKRKNRRMTKKARRQRRSRSSRNN